MTLLQRLLKNTDLLLGVGLLVVVAMLVLPLPTAIIDFGLCIALASAVLILLSAVNVEEPMRFSIFPSLLLVTTLFRLALSIAATKMILGHGEGGHVIETFGNFVMGGDFVVGFVAFLILMAVQFLVITNGAGRVSEVVARFTLDAMPGKQMAIDADLAAGLIDEEGARTRRKEVKQEADFYGAMDGASKFVKGDAIASLLIIVINVIGGFAVGFFRGEGDAIQILQRYALLSVGEGLVSQIPALLISTASGLLVTRSGQERSMGGEVFSQLAGQEKAILASGGFLCLFGFVPGFPTLIFLGVGGTLIAMSRYLKKNGDMIESLFAKKVEKKPVEAAPVGPAPSSPEAVMPLLSVDALEIEVGYALTKLADVKAGGDLPERITATRRQIAIDLGYVMPSVRIRDAITLSPNTYVIKVRGEEVARADVEPELLLAINSGGVVQPIPGQVVKEPVFGLDAVWISREVRDVAERNGYTVIEPSAMISTHLSEIVKAYAAELLSRQEVAQIVENAKQVNAAVVEELVPNVVQIGDIQKVLQHLLRERVPIRDMVTVLETMADYSGRVKDPEQMGELVRSAISRTITRQYLDHENKLYCITLDPSLERRLTDQIQMTAGGSILAVDPHTQQTLVRNIREQSENAMAQGLQAVVLCSATLRLPLRRLVERYIPQLHVLSYNEVSSRAEVEFVGQVQAEAEAAA
ncbi:MAG: flagellar biosynthesis protein FlhA [Chthonomonas sp.]|nr:flagellar biosynthesis protein FlhA [Chthonomonas sp.]